MQSRQNPPRGTFCRFTEFSRFDVLDRNGQNVGSCDDLVFDCMSGQIRHVMIRAGTVLGIGGKSLAVPFQALDIRGNQIQLHRTKDELMRAPWGEGEMTFGPDYERTASTYWGESWGGTYYGEGTQTQY